MERDSYTDEEIRHILSLKKVAVIGMSKHSAKAAHFVPKYLSEHVNFLKSNPEISISYSNYYIKNPQEKKV